MDFGGFSISCIGYGEPTLLAALTITSVLCWLGGSGFAQLLRLIQDPWRRVICLGPVGLLFFLLGLVLPIVTLNVLFRQVHGGRSSVCTHYVWPALLMPAVLFLVSLVRQVRSRKRLASVQA